MHTSIVQFTRVYILVLAVVCSGIFSQLSMPIPAYAEVSAGNSPASGVSNAGNKIEPAKIGNPLKAENIQDLLYLLVGIVLRIGQVVATLALIYSGFLFVKAQGNEKEVSEAKKVFYYTIIGIALLFGAQVLAEIVRSTIEPLLK